MSTKVACRTKEISRSREGQCIIIKGSLYQKALAILNAYAANNSI
jgi:hypothetical protein